MKIMVLIKLVPDLVEELEVDPGGKALAADSVKLTLNEFDDQALEEALLLKEATGGHLTVMALDGAEVDKVLFTALAKGADRALKITGAGEVDGNLALAGLFARVIAQQPCDLVLTGVQAADDRDGQLAPMVAALLDWPSVEVVTGTQPAGPVGAAAAGSASPSASAAARITLHKEYAGGLMGEFEVTLPAVLGIQAARQPPRYAPVSKVRQVQQTTAIEALPGAAPGGDPGPTVLVMTPPAAGGGAQMLEDAGELLAVLESKGVIA